MVLVVAVTVVVVGTVVVVVLVVVAVLAADLFVLPHLGFVEIYRQPGRPLNLFGPFVATVVATVAVCCPVSIGTIVVKVVWVVGSETCFVVTHRNCSWCGSVPKTIDWGNYHHSSEIR